MNIQNILPPIIIKRPHPLPCGCIQRTLKVPHQPAHPRLCPILNVVLFIHLHGLLRDPQSLIDTLCRAQRTVQETIKALGEAVFVVIVDSGLEGLVGEGVAVGEIFGEDSSAGFVFLGEVMGVGVRGGGGGGGGSGSAVEGDGGGDADLGGAEVGVLEEEGCSGCGGAFKCDDGFLFFAIRFQSQGLDFATEGEEVGDLLLGDIFAQIGGNNTRHIH